MKPTRPQENAPVTKDTELHALSLQELSDLAEAGEEIRTVEAVLERTGDNVVSEILRNQGPFYEWETYPAGGVEDRETHAQYYYHAHAPDRRPATEHGHFHTFLGPQGMPRGIRPAPAAPGHLLEAGQDGPCHLIAVSMDGHGRARALFTVNRWVTGETLYRAHEVNRMLDRFAIGHAQPSWPTNRWITAMLRFFRPQICALVRERDRQLARWQSSHPSENVLEDRRLEITSWLDIDVEQQMAAIDLFQDEKSLSS
ncbi:DUF6969 family protein [Fodinicurvata fenggangensis]|uniref:DUF6969 family protein n=1 Tax=Fodinicurvata fenggangensis TaxID=1121830 RepID=UPI00068F1009|nr:hypothetical protein [Fodinicurvata fenggangensis]